MKFKQNPTIDCLINKYGLDRFLVAIEQDENNDHVELCWFFIADYCRDMYISPFNPDTYNSTKSMFYRIIRGYI